MKPNIEEILSEILMIIKYPRDRKEFIDKFCFASKQEALLSLLENLPEEKRTELKNKIENETDSEKIKEIVNLYFSPEEFEQAHKKSTDKVLEDYIKMIVITLPEDRKEALRAYFTKASILPTVSL